MITLDKKSLVIYSEVVNFFKTKNNFNENLSKEVFKKTYEVTLLEQETNASLSRVKQTLTLIELCAILGLDKHMEVLTQLKGFIPYLLESENSVFYFTVVNGHLLLLKELERVLPKDILVESLLSNHADLIKLAIHKKHPHLFSHMIKSLSSDNLLKLFKAKRFEMFRLAAPNIDLELFKLCTKEFQSEDFTQAISLFNYEVYRQGAQKSLFALLEYFESNISEIETVAAIKSQSYDAFSFAAENGQLNLIEHFESKLAEVDVVSAIKEHSFESFCLAAENDNFDVLNAIKSKNYRPFRLACQKGHLDILKHFASKLTKEELLGAIDTRSFESFRLAAEKGNLEVLKYIEEVCLTAEVNIINAIKADKFDAFNYDAFRFDAFRSAAENGHLELLKHFEEKFLDNGLELSEAIRSYSFEPFRLAAKNGFLPILKHFESTLAKANIDITLAIEANSFYAYHYAAANGQVPILLYLESKLSKEKKVQALKSRNYYAFYYAIRNGQLEALKHIEKCLKEENILPKTLIKDDQFKAFYSAAKKGWRDIVHHCLSIDMVFAYAESRGYEYAEQYTNVFIEAKINGLKERQSAYNLSDPKNPFDIKNTEAQLFFYIIRNLIRRKSSALNEYIQMLIQIHSIQCLVHKNISGDGENELLRFALRMGNEEAVRVLIALEPVIKHAEENGFYETIWGPYGALDLKQMILGETLETKKITEDEQRMLDLFEEKYKEAVDNNGGIDLIFEELTPLLITRYKKEPIYINTPKNKNIMLPYDLKGYEKLIKLYEQDKDFSLIAIKAFYDDPTHCVLRCLNRQAFWLQQRNLAEPKGSHYIEHWSIQEEYLPTIAYLYLAASERKTGKEKNDASEERVTLFIKLFSSLCGMDYSSTLGQ